MLEICSLTGRSCIYVNFFIINMFKVDTNKLYSISIKLKKKSLGWCIYRVELDHKLMDNINSLFLKLCGLNLQ